MITKEELIEILRDFKLELREELEAEAKLTRSEFVISSSLLNEKFDRLGNRMKNVEINVSKLSKKTDMLQQDIRTLDLKTETFHQKLNTKIDNNHNDEVNSFESILDTIDELNTQLIKRVDRIEKHLSLSDG